MSEQIQVNDDNFKKTVLRAKLPVLVDFWAPWCAPCYMVAPILEELAKEYVGKVLFAKLNVDEGQRIALKYSILSIPTLIIFNEGEEIDRIIGAVPKRTVQNSLRRIAIAKDI